MSDLLTNVLQTLLHKIISTKEDTLLYFAAEFFETENFSWGPNVKEWKQ
jgi:hypothetical protein